MDINSSSNEMKVHDEFLSAKIKVELCMERSHFESCLDRLWNEVCLQRLQNELSMTKGKIHDAFFFLRKLTQLHSEQHHHSCHLDT